MLDLTKSNIFRLVLLASESDDSDFAWTTWFNLSSSSVAGDGSVISSATEQPSSTPLPASATEGGTTTPTLGSGGAIVTTIVSPSGLDAATRISIGVGVGIGVPLLLAVVMGAYVILKRWGPNDGTRMSCCARSVSRR